jgi:N-ethylmaleimide reductase
MDEITTTTRTPGAVPAPETDSLFQPYRLGPFNLPYIAS